MHRFVRATLLSLLVGLLAVPVAEAASTLAQGFKADSGRGAIVTGALVSFKSGNSDTVELATTGTANRLAGVVDSSPLVTLSGGEQETQVVLGGTTAVLVTDINGPVKSGDKITISPITGVGMLTTSSTQVVGTAQSAFSTKGAQTRKIKDKQGREQSVHIGLIALQVGVASYRSPGSDYLPPFVQSLANGIAGRPVSLTRILLSGALLLFGLVALAIFSYSSIRNAMISIGRNPLAAPAIRRGLLQMAIITLMVLAGSLVASYIILIV